MALFKNKQDERAAIKFLTGFLLALALKQKIDSTDVAEAFIGLGESIKENNPTN